MYTFRNPAGLSAASGKEMGNAPASRTSQRPKAIIVYCFSQKNLSFSPSCIPFRLRQKARFFVFFEDLSSVSPIRERVVSPAFVCALRLYWRLFCRLRFPVQGIYFFTVFSKRACHNQRPIRCFFAEDFPARRFPPNGGSHFAAVFHWPLVHAVPQK